MIRHQAIIWTNADQIHWRIYAALGADGLIKWINFNPTVEVWEWISSFVPLFIMDVITYPCWDLS